MTLRGGGGGSGLSVIMTLTVGNMICESPLKGSLTRQKLQNSKFYAKSREFSPALRLIIFGKKSVATNLR